MKQIVQHLIVPIASGDSQKMGITFSIKIDYMFCLFQSNKGSDANSGL